MCVCVCVLGWSKGQFRDLSFNMLELVANAFTLTGHFLGPWSFNNNKKLMVYSDSVIWHAHVIVGKIFQRAYYPTGENYDTEVWLSHGFLSIHTFVCASSGLRISDLIVLKEILGVQFHNRLFCYFCFGVVSLSLHCWELNPRPHTSKASTLSLSYHNRISYINEASQTESDK